MLTSPEDLYQYAQYSANSYDGSYIPPGSTLVAQRTTENGFAAYAYRVDGSNQVVIVYRGMDDVKDAAAVAQILFDQVPQQYHDAMQFRRPPAFE